MTLQHDTHDPTRDAADARAAAAALVERWGGRGHDVDLGLPDGTPVHYVGFGGPEAAADRHTPVVLVHGLGGSHLNWVLLAPLLRTTAQVYAPDLAGFGLTGGGGQVSAVRANVRLLARFLREVVGEPAVVVGNSMGGMISLLLTAEHPDLVDRLVLLDPSIPTRRRHLDRRVAATFLLYGIPRVGEAFVGRLTAGRTDRQRVLDTTNLCFADPTLADPDVLDAAEELVGYRRRHAPDAEAAYLGAARSLLQVLGRRGGYRPTLHAATRPVLLIHGDRDRLVPVQAARTAAAEHPEWASAVLPGVGHVPMLERPQVVADLLHDWLDRARLR